MNNYANYIRNRNYGCRIKQYICNGVETVSMENELIKVTVLAGKGTDIVEFLYKPLDLDFMWHSYNDLKNPSEYIATKASSRGVFHDYYAGGWQELFPVYGEPCDYMGAEMGLHGEVCLNKWEYCIEADTVELIRVKFTTRTVRSPFLLEKWLTLKTGDPRLYIEEKVTNESPVGLRFMWGQHPVFGPVFLDTSCEIQVNGNCQTVFPKDTAGFKKNSTFQWPVTENINGERIDLSKIMPPGSTRNLTYAITDLNKGEYTVWNNNMNVGFGMEWDVRLFPYIWVWAPCNGQDGYPWYGRCYALGVEPWSHLVSDFGSLKDDEGIFMEPYGSIETRFEAFVKT